MRIVLTSNYKIGSETGASAVTDLLTNKLSQKHKVVYICIDKKLEIVTKTKNLTVITLPSFDLKGINFPLISPQAILLITKNLDLFKPDIIHTQNHVLISKVVQVWGNLNRIPVVVTFHHIPTQSLEHLLPDLAKSIFGKLVQEFYNNTTIKNYLNKCQAVISINKKQYIEIKKTNKHIKNVIVSNGIELNKYLKIKRQNPKKIFNFIYLGSYSERKNQILLVDTFTKLPLNYKLFLFGNFKSGGIYLDKIRKILKVKKIKNVFLNDFVDKNKIIKVYKKANYFISASKKEVQSLAVIEALASGLPVIGIENETINDLINKKNGIRVNRNINPKQLAYKIVNFVVSCNYLELSKKAREKSLEFDINKTILKIEKVYKSLRNSKS